MRFREQCPVIVMRTSEVIMKEKEIRVRQLCVPEKQSHHIVVDAETTMFTIQLVINHKS